ncbi:hypothetical protein SAMN05421820_103383 [Pedobacter steynii]|uniref:Uncharacterized protein n=1 Tax=Pedobacter steynii TaxID=430522 RepID=A0A1G9RWT9_9SPHI|nr:hypothetical protein SAMN05421820_103383 [Pedobacter steynii]
MANWYTYVYGDPQKAGSYFYSVAKPVCTTGVKVCAVLLDDTSTTVPAQVNLDPLLPHISNGLMTLIPQPTGLGVQRLVYLKCNC